MDQSSRWLWPVQAFQINADSVRASVLAVLSVIKKPSKIKVAVRADCLGLGCALAMHVPVLAEESCKRIHLINLEGLHD